MASYAIVYVRLAQRSARAEACYGGDEVIERVGRSERPSRKSTTLQPTLRVDGAVLPRHRFAADGNTAVRA